MTARDALAFRASLDARLMNRSRELGYDVNRLRRHVVFHRILARLAPRKRWVLKGGYALEVRLARGARATKDLDLVVLDSLADLHSELLDALADDIEGDGFRFEIHNARPIAPDDAGNDAVRFSIRARLAGREFAAVVVDAVGRSAEMADAVGALTIPPPVAAPGLEPVRIAVVDIAQHAAEKFHAMSRRYSGDRPSTRVKDLVDLVLMLETGLLPDAELGARLRAVYQVRDGRDIPTALPDPPAAWRREFGALAAGVGLVTVDLDAAMEMVRAVYRDAVA